MNKNLKFYLVLIVFLFIFGGWYVAREAKKSADCGSRVTLEEIEKCLEKYRKINSNY